MAKLTARTCETKPDPSGRDRVPWRWRWLVLADQATGTRTWIVEYEFQAHRRKYTIGAFDTAGAPGQSITAWLEHGRLSLGQARAIAAEWEGGPSCSA